MEATAFVVPAIATLAFGGALLVPIRDSRKGRKATISGRTPLTLGFGERLGTPSSKSSDLSALASDACVRVDVIQVPNGRDALGSIRTFLERLRTKVSGPSHPLEASIDAALPDFVLERSFADELAALLPVGTDECESLALADSPRVAGAPFLEDARAPIAAASEHHDGASASVALPSTNRIVPLTRLPLRHTADSISWPASVEPPLAFPHEAARYAFLRRAARARSVENDAFLARAFHEETPEGRWLVLAALSRASASRPAIETFAAALATGSDEERVAAVDALADAGARDEIASALSDRIGAIAARAALAFVGSTIREDYRTALAPFVDDARVEVILSLLAGVVE